MRFHCTTLLPRIVVKCVLLWRDVGCLLLACMQWIWNYTFSWIHVTCLQQRGGHTTRHRTVNDMFVSRTVNCMCHGFGFLNGCWPSAQRTELTSSWIVFQTFTSVKRCLLIAVRRSFKKHVKTNEKLDCSISIWVAISWVNLFPFLVSDRKYWVRLLYFEGSYCTVMMTIKRPSSVRGILLFNDNVCCRLYAVAYV